jgi:hypothetical protein
MYSIIDNKIKEYGSTNLTSGVNDGSINVKENFINTSCNSNMKFIVYLITSMIFIAVTAYITYTISRQSMCYTILATILAIVISILLWIYVFKNM